MAATLLLYSYVIDLASALVAGISFAVGMTDLREESLASRIADDGFMLSFGGLVASAICILAAGAG